MVADLQPDSQRGRVLMFRSELCFDGMNHDFAPRILSCHARSQDKVVQEVVDARYIDEECRIFHIYWKEFLADLLAGLG